MGVLDETLASLQRFMERFTPAINKAVIFFLILFLGFLIGKILGRLVRTLLADLKADEFGTRLFGRRVALERTLAGLVAGLVYAASVYFALDALGATTAVLLIVLVVFLLVFLLTAILATRDAVQNATARLLWKHDLRPGTHIRIDETEGTIVAINLLDTVLETRGGDTVHIPNALFLRRNVTLLKRKPKGKPSTDGGGAP